MKLYIDSDYKCHVANDGTMTEVETDFFKGRCDAYIEGYRFIPAGKTWTRSDGEIFYGEMIAPWTNYKELDNEQRAYEKQILAEYESAMKEIETALGV